jgi:hypothetical protein
MAPLIINNGNQKEEPMPKLEDDGSQTFTVDADENTLSPVHTKADNQDPLIWVYYLPNSGFDLPIGGFYPLNEAFKPLLREGFYALNESFYTLTAANNPPRGLTMRRMGTSTR